MKTNKSHNFILIIVLFSLVSAIHDVKGRSDTNGVRISFIGDVMMHGPVQSCAFRNNQRNEKKESINNRGYDYLFARISRQFQGADMTIANMEFPVARPFITRGLTFNCFPEVIPAMKKAGITHVTLANNHNFDQGIPGLHATIDCLAKYELPSMGAHKTEKQSRKYVLYKKNDLTIAVLAYTNLMNYPHHLRHNGKNFFINHLSDTKVVLADIARARSEADYVILVSHAGLEYKVLPEKSDRRLYKKYCDNGVDLVIGHHPHVVQPIEKYLTKNGRVSYIFYSLGNFISNQTRYSIRYKNRPTVSTQDSFIVNCYFRKQGDSVAASFQLMPITTKNIRHYTKKGSYKDIQTVTFSEEITRVKSLIEKKPSKRNKWLLVTLQRRLDSLQKVLLWYKPGQAVSIIE